MTDNLGTALATAMTGVIDLYFVEAEADKYPYCVYDRIIREQRTKEGVYAISSELTLHVISDTYSEAKSKAISVRAAVEGLGSSYFIAFQSMEPLCVEGVWDFVIDYNIKQIS